MRQNLHSVLPWLACSAALLLAPSAAAQTQLAAGASIPNTATASYLPPDSTTPTTSTTNTVTTTVGGVCSTTVTASNSTQTANLLPGEQGMFGFTVANGGNTTSTVGLSAVVAGGAGSVHIYSDTNGNGKLDSGEPEITQVELAAGAKQQVVVVVDTSQNAAAGDYTVTLSGTCGSGDVSAATSKLNLGELPDLSISKAFDKDVIKPGDSTTVTVTTINNGGDSNDVYITDPLQVMMYLGLVFDGGAQASAGTLEYTTDEGYSWQTTQPADASSVTGVRVHVPSIAKGSSITLSFKMKALEAANERNFVNVARVFSGGKTVEGTASVHVHYTPQVFIGPEGNPQAPDGTPDDTQTKTFAVVGDNVCFNHTVKNTGDVTDAFSFTVTYPTGTAQATIKDANGNPITGPVTLAPGETKLVNVCYDLTTVGSLDAQVTVTGARGTSNSTHDLITTIEMGLPELKKTSDASATDPLATGSTINYTLSVHNPYNRPLNNVVVTDPLPAHTDFVSADNGGVSVGQSGAQTVSWNVGTLAAGETKLVTVTVKVNDQAVDGEQIANTFHMGSKEFEKPLDSNTTNNVVWNAQIRIDKKVSSPEVTPGDAVTYTLVIHNDSPQGELRDAVVTDTPAPGLVFIPGTATIDGQPLADPSMDSSGMNWSVGTLLPQKDVTITYKMRVTPTVSGDLVNTVQVVGYAGDASKAIRKVASNRASALTRPRLLNFAPLNDIVGSVFVDRNRNGIFDKTLDTPVDRARVILAGGRLALTDKDGRYHFANVPLGTQALRLDPVTTTYSPLNTPQTQGLSGTQTVFVRGLTSVDFPLAPLGGDISAIRRTSVDMGPLHMDKVVYHTDQGYVVSLKLNSSKALDAFVLDDTLPEGATLQEGSNTWKGTLPTGETTVIYRFAFAGGDEAAVTDPNVAWRY